MQSKAISLLILYVLSIFSTSPIDASLVAKDAMSWSKHRLSAFMVGTALSSSLLGSDHLKIFKVNAAASDVAISLSQVMLVVGGGCYVL